MTRSTIRLEAAEAQARLNNTRHRPDPISDHWLGRKICEACNDVWHFWLLPPGRGCRPLRRLVVDLRAKQKTARRELAKRPKLSPSPRPVCASASAPARGRAVVPS